VDLERLQPIIVQLNLSMAKQITANYIYDEKQVIYGVKSFAKVLLEQGLLNNDLKKKLNPD
jgi:hypothetical protein